MSVPFLRLSAVLPCFAALVAGGAGCATPRDPWFDSMVESGQIEPASEVERAVLSRLDAIPPDAPTPLDGRRVVAGEAYVSASGRVCRTLSIEGSSARLACRDQGGEDGQGDAEPAWFLAPDVFGAAPSETAVTAGADVAAPDPNAGGGS